MTGQGDSKNTGIFDVAAVYYCEKLTSQQNEYLIEARGLTKESIGSFKVGYSPGGVYGHLKNRGFNDDEIKRSGLVKDSKRDFLHGCITIPYLQDGRIVTIRGRRQINDGTKTYLSLPGSKMTLYNSDALRSASGSVLLCEGEFDSMTAVQNGFAAVGVPGALNFKPEWTKFFRPAQIPVVVFDADEAGQQGIIKAVDSLGPLIKIVNLPEGLDLNEYFRSGHTSAEFSALTSEARLWIDLEIQRVSSLSDPIRSEHLKLLIKRISDLDDLTRAPYEKKIATTFKARVSTIRDEISRTRSGANGDQRRATSDMQITEEQKQAALKLLCDPDLLQRLIRDTEAIGCVGEENNKVVVYLALTSRLLSNPISLLVKGDSSGGKSFLVETLCRLFPESEVLQFTTITAKALYHRTDDLSNKALVIYERPGAEESDYPLRSLQSEKKLVISSSVKDLETGRWITEDHEILGPIALIETTTQMQIHPENETRCFQIFIDDSEEQTAKILQTHRLQYRPDAGSRLPNLGTWIAAQKMLRPLRVAIPFVDFFPFPTKPLRVRRDFQRFLTLIEVSAFLHQYQREIRTFGSVDCVLACIEDYVVAYELASVILQQTVKQLSPKAEQLIHEIHEMCDHSGTKDFTRQKVVRHTTWDIKTVKKYLNECLKLDMIEIIGGGNGTAYQYKLVRLPDEHDNLLMKPEELEKLIEATDLSEQGTPIQNPNGQVIPQQDNELSEPIQPVPGEADVNINDKDNGIDSVGL